MIPVSNAINAYSQAVKSLGGTEGAGAAANTAGGLRFADLVEGSAQSALDQARHSEGVSANALVGQADLTDVVTAVSNAEVTLQTIVSLRDRVVGSIQEIMRMPI